MKRSILLIYLLVNILAKAQIPVDLSDYDKKGGATATVTGNTLEVTWPTDEATQGRMILDLQKDNALLINFAEIISVDGRQVYRQTILLQDTQAFGKEKFNFTAHLKKRKWVRFEVWDIAANGAFTQMVWLE